MSRTYPEFFARLSDKTPSLFPLHPADPALSAEITGADLFPSKSGDFVELCRAGLLLWNDDLDAAHPISQNIETPTGNFWHAVIHRREADFSNANYWWNRVGNHPVFEEIHDLVLHRTPDFAFLDELRNSGRWEPRLFTDFCQKARNNGALKAQLEGVQRLEMRALLEWCAAQVK